ncbi:hypothetical protein ACOMHN_029107 [Nucella lapillus]
MTSLFLLWVLLGIGCEAEMKRDNAVSVDLRYGLVTSYSPYISFLQTPTAPLPSGSNSHACSSQAVVRVSLRGPYKGVRLELEYGDSPRLWTLDVTDSPLGNGYGGHNSTPAAVAMAEAHIHNRQLRVYGNGLPGYLDASLNGGHLLHVMEDVVKKGSRLWLDISDRRLEIGMGRGATLQDMESPYLFSLGGRRHPPGGGSPAGSAGSYRDVYIGLNRVVAGTGGRVGNGLCKVDISLYEFGAQLGLGSLVSSESIVARDQDPVKRQSRHNKGTILQDTGLALTPRSQS